MNAVTLRVLCEGATESNFVSQVLRPHLSAFRVFARPEPLRMGNFGIVSFEKLRKAIQADVGRSRAHEYVTTMIDLYGLGDYPGIQRCSGEPVLVRVARIEHEMAEGLPNPRFLPYVQLHEFESLVLVDVDRIPGQFPNGEADNAPEKLRAEIGETEPELVDDGPDSAPSKRIIKVVRGYSALKSVAGPAIAGAIGLPTLRDRCPHFGEWLTKLESLAEGSGL